MSYSRTEYPRTSRTQRAGTRDQGTPQASYNPQPVNSASPDTTGGDHELGSEGAWTAETGASVNAAAERTPQRSGSHYVLQPNPVKNEKLRRTARQEEARYQQHRAEAREKLAQRLSQERPRALGGSAHSREELQELRQKQEREQQLKAKYAGVYRKQKREAYQQAKRQRENEEIEKRKQIQREKMIDGSWELGRNTASSVV